MVTAMAKVLEFYVPEKFRKPSGKRIPPEQWGRSSRLPHRKRNRHATEAPRFGKSIRCLASTAGERQGLDEFERKPTMTCRIDRLVVEDMVVLRICGRITRQDADMLRALLEQETSAVAIDLKHVLLVDHEAVKLLALHQSKGSELRNCSAYIREWITRERAFTNAPEQWIEGGEDVNDA
jgi:hypothetical protein